MHIHLIDPAMLSWLFLWHGFAVASLALCWLLFTVYLVGTTQLKSLFWFSMSVLTVSVLFSLVVMSGTRQINSSGWYLARCVESSGAMLVMVSLMSDIFGRYKSTRQNAQEAYGNAIRDPMTRLFNRGYFYDKLTHALSLGTPENPVSVIFCDIDNFKRVNDTFGHPQGDRVINHLSGMLIRAVREQDIVARTGGEEFAILLPDTTSKVAGIIAERLRYRVEHATPFSTDNDFPYTITISSGICSVCHTISVNDCIQIADDALYQAKRKGRNCVVSGTEGNVLLSPSLLPGERSD